MNQDDRAIRVAKVAIQISDAGGLEEICTALDRGRLDYRSSGPVRSALAGGNPTVETCICSLQDLWRTEPELSGTALALALRSSVATAADYRSRISTTQVVWTGLKVEGSYVRSTREVVRELLRGAQRNILVVGYWIAGSDDGDGIINEFISSLVSAVRRGVSVIVIVDERRRADGTDNQRTLVTAWPAGIQFPRILTWRLPPDDRHLKLHAKVLIADGADVLVTSANLTFYAMDRNMEMGVRIVGQPAMAIASHFQRLIDTGVIEDFEHGKEL